MAKNKWRNALVLAVPQNAVGNSVEEKLSFSLIDKVANGKIKAIVLEDENTGAIAVEVKYLDRDEVFPGIFYNNKIYLNQTAVTKESAEAAFDIMLLATSDYGSANPSLNTNPNLQLLTDSPNSLVPWYPLSFTVPIPFVSNLKLKYAIDLTSAEYFSFEETKKIRKNIENDFVIRTNDSYNSLENERVQNNKLVEGFVPLPEDNACVERIYQWITKKGYAPSFFFYGPAGTGKSEVGKYFSKVTGIPYTFVTCSAMTNESDLRGKPNKLSQNGNIIKFAKRVLKNIWNKDIETQDIDNDEILYSVPELVLGCKYGWIIEVQEAAHIIDAGTLGFLNCTLDTNRVLTLPNGEQLKLHPNTTFIFTTNVNYEGCNPFNLSLLSRMCYTRKFNNLTEKEQVDRVLSVTDYQGPEEDVSKVIQCISELNNIIADNDITQGVCDLRSAINCIEDFQLCGGSLRNSARLTIEDKVSLEPGFEEQIKIKLDSILGEF